MLIGPNQFMFWGSFVGQSINVLANTGATTRFVSKSCVDQHQVLVNTLLDGDVLNVRSVNNSLEKLINSRKVSCFLAIMWHFRSNLMLCDFQWIVM